MAKSGEVPRCFGLRDVEGRHEVADTDFIVIGKQPQHAETGFIGKHPEEVSSISHIASSYIFV
jgi:hypothetical protein